MIFPQIEHERCCCSRVTQEFPLSGVLDPTSRPARCSTVEAWSSSSRRCASSPWSNWPCWTASSCAPPAHVVPLPRATRAPAVSAPWFLLSLLRPGDLARASVVQRPTSAERTCVPKVLLADASVKAVRGPCRQSRGGRRAPLRCAPSPTQIVKVAWRRVACRILGSSAARRDAARSGTADRSGLAAEPHCRVLAPLAVREAGQCAVAVSCPTLLASLH